MLPATFVIHTVGPRWRRGNRGEPELLASCYKSSLTLAAANGVRSIAFPAISCGVYGFPIEQAARIAVREVQQFLANNETPETVSFVCFSESDLGVYRKLMGN